MSTKEEINKVLEQLGCADYSKYSFNELMQQYDTLKAIENFENTPSQFVESPRKKAKEMALDAAIKNKTELLSTRIWTIYYCPDTNL